MNRLACSLAVAIGALNLPQATAAERPAWPAHRVAAAPALDGELNDPTWGDIPALTQFIQAEPDAGLPATERTEVRLAYDDQALYLAVRAHTLRPDTQRATVMQRDSDQRADDSFTLVLDTFGSGRSGYIFQVNPLGAQRDGLVSPGTGRDGVEWEWDGLWVARARRDAQGWTAEISIPFATLAFSPQRDTWGFNLQRVIKHQEEVVRWTATARNQVIASIAEAGTLEGLVGLRTGLGLDVRPSLILQTSRDRGQGRSHTELKPGLDLFYKVTPSITAALTLNTDFAETEVDDLTVNLTRFPVFFPEKRAFFLQDTAIFNFGGIERSPRPFFSRRIGLAADRTPLDVLAGLKLTGRVGAVNFGVLDVQMEETAFVPSLNLGVARASVNILDESTAGLIFTRGDPRTDTEHWLGGADFNYRNSNWAGTGQVVGASVWVQRSDSDFPTGSPWAYGAELDYPNDTWGWMLSAEQIDPGFDPALGFINQTDVRNYRGELRHTLRPAKWDRIDLNMKGELTTDLTGRVDRWLITVPDIFLSRRSRDAASFKQFFHRENLVVPFRIAPGVVIPAGDYHFLRHEVWVRSSTSRPLSGRVLFAAGRFYGGQRTDYAVEPEWRPSGRFTAAARLGYNDIRLPQGDFTVRFAQLRTTVALSPAVIWNTVLQYDNQSSALGFNTRLRWTIEPGRDVYLIVSRGYFTDDGHFRPTLTEASMKAAWTWRF